MNSSDVTESVATRSQAMRAVNEAIRRSVAMGVGERWDFFCECDDATCRRLVNLSLVEYDAHRGTTPSLPLLAEPHRTAA